MCGLIGIAGDIDHETRNRLFKDFLDTCASRGRDSTGVVKVAKDSKSYSWAKQLGSPAYLYDSRQWDRHIEGEAAVLIGHCRSKTIGDVSIRNAHPFDFPEEGIIGVHNGTLRGQHNLDTYHHQKVDSEVLYGHLAKNGVEDTFKKVEGAYACVWWDNDAGTLNFIRNSERPLFITWSADYRTMYWASEIWMFGAIARKKKLWEGDKNGVYHELPIHTLWSFRINPAAKGDEKVLSLRTPKEIKPEKKSYQPPVHTRTGGHQQANGMGAHGNPGSGTGYWQLTQTGRRWVERGNGWTDRGNGVHERAFTPTSPATGGSAGGEVVSPFDKAAKRLVTILDASELNDKLQLEHLTQGATPENGTSSPLSNVEFLRNSVARSALLTEPNSTKPSSRSTLSLPGTGSNVSPIRSNVGASESCKGFSANSKNKGLLLTGVSFRVIAGVPYITWNETKREFSETEVMYNTGGACTFCKKTLMDIQEIGEFLNEQQVICNDCLQEPQNDALCYEAC